MPQAINPTTTTEKSSVLKHDATVGRLLLIDIQNPPDLTAEEFMSYISEGFVPVFAGNSSSLPGAVYTFATWSADEQGVVSLSQEGFTICTFNPKYPVSN